MAVHAYGRAQVIDDRERVRDLLDRLVERHERALGTGWSLDGQSDAFMARMTRAIVAFEIPVARWDAKAKLSQNKAPDERRQVVAGLRALGRNDDVRLADSMDTMESITE